MPTLAAIAGLVLTAVVLWDAFETIILPRRVVRRVRLTRAFYKSLWTPWTAVARLLPPGRRREGFLGVFGPLSLLLLFGVWAVGLVAGFGLLHAAAGSAVRVPEGAAGFWTDLYYSGTTFFTLGLGDVAPRSAAEKVLTVFEAGTGFAFLAMVMGYLPVIYQAFSRREVRISLLDARAGSPPTAGALLRRHRDAGGAAALGALLADWEGWCAELMESHLSYPVLAYFRSQHNNQSWLAALTAILDGAAFIMTELEEHPTRRQAELTFAIARHAVVDLAQVFRTPPRPRAAERLDAAGAAALRAELARCGGSLEDGAGAATRLAAARRLYEPYVAALAAHLMLELPPWLPAQSRADNWQTSAWERTAARATPPPGDDDHL